jgi:hypothetical protein
MTVSRQQAELIEGWNQQVAIAAAGQKRNKFDKKDFCHNAGCFFPFYNNAQPVN